MVGASSPTTTLAQQDPEALATVLEAHPDYRLLRRLKPRLHWDGAASQGLVRVVILDTETTGLDHGKDKIMELALLRLDLDSATGLPVGDVQVYDGLQDPGMPIPADVVAITGLTQADVAGQTLDEARIAELLADVDLVIAHNAGFDRPFVEARIPRFRELAWACSFADIDWKAQWRSSAKLENLAQALGLFYDAHRAEMDCHALLAVLAQPLPVPGHSGLAHLVEASAHASYRLQANHAPFDAKDLLKARGYRWNAEQKVWHTFLKDGGTLQTECEWLKEHVYHQRSVVVQLEKLDAHVKYASRQGELIHRQL
ncbi:DNA polymerase III subunit epsilon [Rhodoferax aquaticus]|uniref:DNA polymerase III subunit epsilon n=1 Tax=Rhodoferax aquaticus TaxID=2527691 RepID=A0A515EVV1_9BURK|nr:DNA polymerase III subunit epsilon [Rhodoferax aquaticus]